MILKIPELCLVILIGPSGSGKSTFAREHFQPTEVLSSDFCRALVANDENDQSSTSDAFDVLRYVAAKRLSRGLLTVVDATNVQPEARKPLVELAREHDVLPVAIVLNLPERLCHERNASRAGRDFGPHVVGRQRQQLRRSLRDLQREGFRYVYEMCTPEDVAQAKIERQPLWNNRRWDTGPFDIIGDVHGCFDELVDLLGRLGYAVTASTEEGDAAAFGYTVVAPAGRKAIFLGDLVDRGPKVVPVLKLVMAMAREGQALVVPGNHDVKLLRKLRGKDVKITHGLDQTLRELEAEPRAFHLQVEQFIDSLIGHYVLDGGQLVVAHAGMKERYIGRASSRVRDFALYGETTGETDEFGLPRRHDWAGEYRGSATIVYGHTPVPEADWLNRTINLDTGCVFGGKLTALRWPEREIVSVWARCAYAQPARPLLPASHSPAEQSAQQINDDVLDIEDVVGKRLITTRLSHSVTVPEENAIAALEVMSRFAANPKWLIYLPPTMSPTETSSRPGYLEHPEQAFDYYRSSGATQVVCQEKHMGSRAVVVICRDEKAARRRFAVSDDGIGIIYTRTGRRFFEDRQVESQLLTHLHAAVTKAGLWDELASEWFCLDCELMPWSAKAQDLLKGQYAAVGAAARAAITDALPVLRQASERYASLGDQTLASMARTQQERLARVERYVDAYRRYCWPVNGVADLRLAPFHLLAGEGHVFIDRDHRWHMTTLSRLAEEDGSPILMATSHLLVDVNEAQSVSAGISWWEALTAGGGEGMVVKPLEFVLHGRKGLVQPAVKCRGAEYLRIIYGPEYDAPENVARLKKRGLAAKRSLALREFALGIEALERFVAREPLRKIHECVFGVLALESEPVDPRL